MVKCCLSPGTCEFKVQDRQKDRHKAKPQEAKIVSGAMQRPGGKTRSKGLISGTQTKSTEVNKLFYRHQF